MFEELEKKQTELEQEQKLQADEMLHDEELKLDSDKEKLEKEIKDIKIQLMNNKEAELKNKSGEQVPIRDEVWVLRARKALLIKKTQLKRLNKKLLHIRKLLYGGNREKMD